jgi:hypothetical protein
MLFLNRFCLTWFLVAGIVLVAGVARAQLPNVDDALNKAKEIYEKIKSETPDSTVVPPPDTPPTQPEVSPFAQTLEDVLADSSNVDAAGVRDTIRMYVAKVTGPFAKPKVALPVGYGSAGAVYFLKRYYDEAIYCYAMAAHMQPQNAEWLNDLATALMEREKNDQAKIILEEVVRLYPNLDPPIGNLACIAIDQGRCMDAIPLIQKAISLSPTTGLYNYLYGKAFACNGDSSRAKDQYKKAWGGGYPGSGHEGDPGDKNPGPNDPAGDPNATANGYNPNTNNNFDLNSSAASSKASSVPPAPDFSGNKQIPKAWVGHYEADYVRGKRARIKQYGQGVSGTTVKEDILTCAKDFSMDIDASGNITGHAHVMYVYLGTATNAAMSMAPTFMIASLGNFMATLKDGYQIRNFNFTGRVDPKGIVEINGMPEGKMDFYNVGQWSKIDPWNVLPPPDRSPRGPARMVLATDTSGQPTIYINRDVDFNGDLSLRYQAYIKKSDKPIVCDCKRVEPKKPSCPATEYLKLKAAIGADGKMTVESSRDMKTGDISTVTKVGGGLEGSGMAAAGSVDAAGNVSFEGSAGMLVGSTQYNVQDGSFQMTMGVGINTGSALPGPNKISEKIELVYDSACGWGIKGTAGVTAMSTGAGVEGAIYFSKGK